MAEKKNTKRLVFIILVMLVFIPLAYYTGYEIGKNAAERHKYIETID